MSAASEDGWAMSTLADACEVNPRRPSLAGIPDDTTVLFVPMAAVDEATGTVNEPEHRTLAEVRKKSYRTFGSGDVLFAKITPCMENGKSAVVPEIPSGLGFGSTEFHVLRPKGGVDPRFIWHFVRQERFRRIAEGHMTGSVGQARVPASFIESFPISIPNPGIQAKVVRTLDEAFANSGSARDHLERARRAVGQFRSAILASACSGRLTADWRATHPLHEHAKETLLRHASANADLPVNRRRLKPVHGLALIDMKHEFPKSWAYQHVRELVGLKAILDVQDGNHGELYPRRGDFSPSDGIPFISAESVSDEVMFQTAPRLNEQVARRLRIGFAKEGDVILTHNATVGRAAILKAGAPDVILSTSTTYYRVDKRVVLPEYLLLFMRSHFFQRQLAAVMQQTTRNQVPVTKQVELYLAIPPVAEQSLIVERAGVVFALATSLVSRIEDATAQLERSSQAILARAFRGDLLPSELSTEEEVWQSS